MTETEELIREALLCAMTEKYAKDISCWEYEPPYDVYSFRNRPNGYLFDRTIWGVEQFCLVRDNTVIGQVACQYDGDDLWVGWAQNPCFCGSGNGYLFVKRCVEELRRVKSHCGRIVLRVAVSNIRAIKAYEKADFVSIDTVKDEIAYTNNTEDFYVMENK